MGTSMEMEMEMEMDNFWMEVKTMGPNCRINWTPVSLQICGRNIYTSIIQVKIDDDRGTWW